MELFAVWTSYRHIYQIVEYLVVSEEQNYFVPNTKLIYYSEELTINKCNSFLKIS